MQLFKYLWLSGFLLLSGCAIVASGVDSVKQSGVREGDRQVLLEKEIKRFHDMLSFGRIGNAMAHAAPESRNELSSYFAKAFKTEKLIGHSIDETKFQNDSYNAVVQLTIKFFRNSDLLVKERAVTEVWKFSVGGDWKLASYTSLDG